MISLFLELHVIVKLPCSNLIHAFNLLKPSSKHLKKTSVGYWPILTKCWPFKIFDVKFHEEHGRHKTYFYKIGNKMRKNLY